MQGRRDHDVGVDIYGMLGLVGHSRRSILHLRDRGVGTFGFSQSSLEDFFPG